MRAKISDFVDDQGRLLVDKVRAAGPGIVQFYDAESKKIRLYSAQEAAKVVRFEPADEHKKIKPAD